jgi:hypothetical protein
MLPAFDENMQFDMQNMILDIIIIMLFFILSFYISKNKELFRCSSCGNVFCATCDDGFEEDQVCATCRNIIHRKGRAEASILVKKTILMENYKQNLKVFSRILSAIIPGAGQVLINHPIKGMLMTLLFSIVLFMVIFRMEPFIGPTSYAIHIVFIPIYLFILLVFIIIYLINIFGRK